MPIILAVVCYGVTGFLVYNYFRLTKRMEAMSAVETSTAAALQDIYQGVAAGVGKGYFEQPAEMKGVIECDTPLESELGKQPCVYDSMTVTRKWEEDYEEEDEETGRMVQKTRQGSDTVSSNRRSTVFAVRDDTGTLKVDPEGASIDTEKTVDRFEPKSSLSGGQIAFGGFSFSVGELSDLGHRRTLGYHFHEEVLAVGKRVYVLGNATDMGGELMLQKPREKGQFLISMKSEEELMASSASGQKASVIGAIITFLLGDGCIVWYFLQ